MQEIVIYAVVISWVALQCFSCFVLFSSTSTKPAKKRKRYLWWVVLCVLLSAVAWLASAVEPSMAFFASAGAAALVWFFFGVGVKRVRSWRSGRAKARDAGRDSGFN